MLLSLLLDFESLFDGTLALNLPNNVQALRHFLQYYRDMWARRLASGHWSESQS
jgi:hypothetical protein